MRSHKLPDFTIGSGYVHLYVYMSVCVYVCLYEIVLLYAPSMALQVYLYALSDAKLGRMGCNLLQILQTTTIFIFNIILYVYMY